MSTLPDFTGPGFFAGEAPDGLTTVVGTPQPAEVRVYWRDPADPEAEDVLVASTLSASNGTWRIDNLNPELQYVVRGRKAGFDDVTVVGATPSRTDVVTVEDHLQPREDLDGLDGYVLMDSGLTPFTATVIDPLPFGLSAVMDGRKLLISGTSDDEGLWSSSVRVTSSNGVFVDVPVEVQIQPPSDPHWSKVKALLHFDSGIADETGRTWAVRGTQAIVRAASARFGEGGLRVDGLDSSVDTSASLGITGAVPLTIEGWMRILTYTGPKMPGSNVYRQVFFGHCGSGGARDQFVCIDGGKISLYRDSFYTGGSGAINVSAVNDFPLGEFAHIEYSFDGARIRIFVNGSKHIDVVCANGWAETGYPFRVGSAFNPSYSQYRAGAYADYDEVRITVGEARHIADFVPPLKPFVSR